MQVSVRRKEEAMWSRKYHSTKNQCLLIPFGGIKKILVTNEGPCQEFSLEML